MIGYFQGIAPFTYLSHPNTYCLAHIAVTVAQFLAFHFKAKFDRPRPSQLHPGLVPPVDVPQHAAYPSAHATEAWLLAHCLNAAMQTQGNLPLMEVTHPDVVGVASKKRNALFDMAARIARNREVLGVHYPSDSEAGKRLAWKAFPVLKACP